MTTTNRSVKTRDSAVTILRKLGVAKADYAKFISDDETTGAYLVNVEDAVASLKAPAAETGAEQPAAVQTEVAVADEEDYSPKNNPFAALVKVTPAEKKATKVKAELARRAAVAAAKKAAAAATKKATASAKKTTATKKAAKTEDNPNAGVSDWIRKLILAGKSNAQILEASEKAGFDLTGKKRYFPGWYRFDMKKKGLI